jgi:hypothetical protein
MSSIKLTPLWLFLILLAILIISILFFKKKSSEGLINYHAKTDPGLVVQLPNYTNVVVKLFDNDYFDPKNGNVLRIYGSQYTKTGTPDVSGSSIDYIDLLDRNNIVNQFAHTQSVPVYQNIMAPSYNSWNTYTTNPKYTAVTSNQLFYVAWGTYTYLHVIDMSNNSHAMGYIFAENSAANNTSSFSMTNYSKTINTPIPTYKDVNSNNNAFVQDTRLNNNYHLYQLCSTVYYNQNNGDLILGNYLGYSINTSQQITDKYISYDKNGNQISCFTNSNLSVTNKMWIVEDIIGSNIVIYVNLPNNTTMISVLQKNSDNATYNLLDVKRFLANGGVQLNQSTILPNPDVADLGKITYSCSTNSVPSSSPAVPASSPVVPSGLPVVPSGLPVVPASSPAVPSGSRVSDQSQTLPAPSNSMIAPVASPTAPSRSSTTISNTLTTKAVSPASSIISGASCNAQSIVDGLNKSIDDYNTLFNGLNSLQQNMQNTMNKFNNSSNNGGCGNSGCDTGCVNNQYSGDVNLINDANLAYTDFLNSANMSGMNNAINISPPSVVVPTNVTGRSGIASLLTNTGAGTNNLLTGTGAGTGNLLTGVGVGTGNLLTGTGAGTANLLTGVGVGTDNLLTGTGAGTANLLTGVGVGTGNLLTGVGAGTGNLLTGVGAGTGNLLTDVGAGTGNLLTDVGAGTGNLMTDVGVGTGNLLTLNTTFNTAGSMSTTSMQNQNTINNSNVSSIPSGITNPMNPLTYNGVLTEKPSSNFMPMLTDFSRFGK